MKKHKLSKANIFKSLGDSRRFSHRNIIIYVVVFVVIGSTLLLISQAATPTSSFEAENGTLGTNAVTGTDVTASNGRYLQFKAATNNGSWWKPTSSAPISWHWVIGGPLQTPYAQVQVYDIDGFDNSAATVSALHAQNTKVICYIDVGTYEPGRPDLNLIPANAIGNGVSGWPGEKWLNIADISGLTPMVTSRMQMCKNKGFDAIEPDNIDGYTNNTGFPLTAAHQIAFNKFLAETAHSLGLSIGLKNDVDQTTQLQPYFDWALNEECNRYSECDTMAPFTQANKAVFNAEYIDDGQTTAKFCSKDAAAHINGVLFNLDLDGSTYQPCKNSW